jgi:hypothetical protein
VRDARRGASGARPRNRRYCDARCRRRAHELRRAGTVSTVVDVANERQAHELAPVVPLGDDEHVQELLTRVHAEERLVALVAAGAETNWRAASWLLERRYPPWTLRGRRRRRESPRRGLSLRVGVAGVRADVSGDQRMRAPVRRPVRRSSVGDLGKAGSVRVHGIDVLDLARRGRREDAEDDLLAVRRSAGMDTTSGGRIGDGATAGRFCLETDLAQPASV